VDVIETDENLNEHISTTMFTNGATKLPNSKTLSTESNENNKATTTTRHTTASSHTET
jgi:hypothetical protein